MDEEGELFVRVWRSGAPDFGVEFDPVAHGDHVVGFEVGLGGGGEGRQQQEQAE